MWLRPVRRPTGAALAIVIFASALHQATVVVEASQVTPLANSGAVQAPITQTNTAATGKQNLSEVTTAVTNGQLANSATTNSAANPTTKSSNETANKSTEEEAKERTSKPGGLGWGAVLGIVIGSIVLVIAAYYGVLWFFRRRAATKIQSAWKGKQTREALSVRHHHGSSAASPTAAGGSSRYEKHSKSAIHSTLSPNSLTSTQSQEPLLKDRKSAFGAGEQSTIPAQAKATDRFTGGIYDNNSSLITSLLKNDSETMGGPAPEKPSRSKHRHHSSSTEATRATEEDDKISSAGSHRHHRHHKPSKAGDEDAGLNGDSSLVIDTKSIPDDASSTKHRHHHRKHHSAEPAESMA